MIPELIWPLTIAALGMMVYGIFFAGRQEKKNKTLADDVNERVRAHVEQMKREQATKEKEDG